MKKIVVLFVALFTICGTASAQKLVDALKGAASTLVDELTGGKATEALLPGKWTYSEPAIKLVSENAINDAIASAVVDGVEKKLVSAYKVVGIKEDSCSFVFNSDNTFTARFGKRNLTGTYTYTASSHAVELKFTSSILNLGTLNGFAYLDGNSLDLVFDCSRLINFLKKLGSKVSILNSINTLMQNYDGMMVGFEFDRE